MEYVNNLWESGIPATLVHSSALAGLRTNRANLHLLAGPVPTRYGSRLRKFDSRSSWWSTSDLARCPYLRQAAG